MSSTELKKKLIDTIQNSKDDMLLEEVYRLLEPSKGDMETYKLNDEQKAAVNEARLQIKNGKYLTDEQSNKEIENG
jgi:hypothetical protein